MICLGLWVHSLFPQSLRLWPISYIYFESKLFFDLDTQTGNDALNLDLNIRLELNIIVNTSLKNTNYNAQARPRIRD
jgi:hypothetical protein